MRNPLWEPTGTLNMHEAHVLAHQAHNTQAPPRAHGAAAAKVGGPGRPVTAPSRSWLEK